MGSQDAKTPFALAASLGSSAQLALWQAGNHWNAIVAKSGANVSQCREIADSQFRDAGDNQK